MKNKKIIRGMAVFMASAIMLTGCSTIQEIIEIQNGTTLAPIEVTKEDETTGEKPSGETSGEYETEEPVTSESEAGGDSPDNPDNPTTSSTKPTTPSTNPTTSSTKPTTPSTNPTTSSTKPSTPSTNPTTSSTKPSTPSTNPTTEPTQGRTEEPTTIIIKTEDDRLEAIFWEKYGDAQNVHTTAQNKAACKAAISLVKDIMANYATDFDREMALHDYICKLCVYDSTSVNAGDISKKQSPYAVLVEHSAVNQGYARTFYICLNMMGIDARYVSGNNHAWTQVCIAGDWYEVDCSMDDEGSIPSYKYFNLTTAQMNAEGYSKYNASRPIANCAGGEYGREYFNKKVTAEFKKDVEDIYFDTVGKVQSYIRKKSYANTLEMEIYMTKAVGTTVADTTNFIKGLGLNGIYDYEATFNADVYSGMWEILDTSYLKLKLIDLSFYESMENYFTDENMCLSYLNGKTASKSATIYCSKDMYDNYIASSGWTASKVTAKGKLGVLYQYDLKYTK